LSSHNVRHTLVLYLPGCGIFLPLPYALESQGLYLPTSETLDTQISKPSVKY
jgi:hypothetical protein